MPELKFQNQELIIDYITLEFPSQKNFEELIHYLFQIGFNCFEVTSENIQNKFIRQVKKSIKESGKNEWQVFFVRENSNKFKVHFSGENGLQFYELILKNSVDLAYFSHAILYRFDLCYIRKKRETDQMSVVNFLSDLIKDIDKKEKKFKLEKNTSKGGYILRTRNRRSNNYFRIYEKEGIGLKFELEMKGSWIQGLISLLLENQSEEFEQKLSLHFLTSFGRLFNLHYPYFDWLAIRLRPLRQKLLVQSSTLNSDYLQSEIIIDTEKFIHLILFLTYAQTLDFDIEYLGSVPYRKVVFPVRDFIQFQNNNDEIPSQYQYQKVLKYFQDLQLGLHVTKFKDINYRSLTLIPQVQFKKYQRFTIAKVWLVEELFYYKYPFYLPNLFKKTMGKHEKQVAVKLIQIITSESIQKIVFMEKFFESYPARLNHQNKSKIKRYLIELVNYLQEQRVIESKYQYIYQGNFIHTKQLTTRLISEGFVIYEKINI